MKSSVEKQENAKSRLEEDNQELLKKIASLKELKQQSDLSIVDLQKKVASLEAEKVGLQSNHEH